MNKADFLRTDILPKYNCSNCEHFCTTKEIVDTNTTGRYAIECKNVVHPLEDCILRGFKAHSKQVDFNQTLNKKK